MGQEEEKKKNSKELQPGDLIVTGKEYQPPSKNFMDNLLTEYKFMFEEWPLIIVSHKDSLLNLSIFMKDIVLKSNHC